jgi:hypothetical protein
MYDDDDTAFEHADEATLFEPCPWGSRQRCMPRRTFKAAVSVAKPPPVPRALARPVAPAPAPAFPSLPVMFVPAEPLRRDRERYIATERVPRVSLLAPKPSQLRRRLTIIAVPLGALVGVLALVFARPAAARVETASPLARLVDADDVPIHVVSNIEQPPAAQPTVTPHAVRATIVKPAHVAKRPTLAFDTSTPLGDLARRRR